MTTPDPTSAAGTPPRDVIAGVVLTEWMVGAEQTAGQVADRILDALTAAGFQIVGPTREFTDNDVAVAQIIDESVHRMLHIADDVELPGVDAVDDLHAAGFQICGPGEVVIPLELASHIRTAVRWMVKEQDGRRYWADIERSLEEAIARSIVQYAAIARAAGEEG